jgi:hypothetical protein
MANVAQRVVLGDCNNDGEKRRECGLEATGVFV